MPLRMTARGDGGFAMWLTSSEAPFGDLRGCGLRRDEQTFALHRAWIVWETEHQRELGKLECFAECWITGMYIHRMSGWG